MNTIFINKKEIKIIYPPKVDPKNDTWVIAFDLNLSRLYEYAKDSQNDTILNGKSPESWVSDLRVIIFNEIYESLRPFGFDKRLQNSIVFNDNPDVTKVLKAFNLGLSKSWAKYFIERVHFFKVDPSSDASELLDKDIQMPVEDRPDWLNDSLLDFIMKPYEDENFEEH
jgi:virulence-associated protein VapD